MQHRVLTHKSEILEAKKLIYTVFIQEQQWQIKKDNPSGLHVRESPQGQILCDNHDSVATWLGVFDNNQLIACNRLCTRLNGKFELEHYHPLARFIKEDEFALEVNRLVIARSYRRTKALPILIQSILTFFLTHNQGHLFGAAVFPNPGKFYTDKVGLTKYGSPFLYYKDDPDEVYLVYLNCHRKDYVKQVILRLNQVRL